MAANVLLEYSVDCKPSKEEILRGFISDTLSTAAQEISAVVARTVSGYEEEASALRQEIDRQKRILQLLLQPRVTLGRTDEAVCKEEEEEKEQHTHVEDSGSCEGEDEEEEEEEEESSQEPEQSSSLDQEDPKDPEFQPPNKRGQTVKTVNLRVCLFQDSQTGVFKRPVQVLRCPRGLKEPDFLDLMRSTFPLLTGPLEVFTANAEKKLKPLKVRTLTPEQIHRSIKSTGKGRSALYIRVKQSLSAKYPREDSVCEDEEEEESSQEPGQSSSLDQADPKDQDHQTPNKRGQTVKTVNLRVCLFQDSQTGVFKRPVQVLRCPRGLKEPDFLDLMRSTFPLLTGPLEVFTANAEKKLKPLKVRTLTPEQIHRSIKSTGKGRSALYIRVKREDPHTDDSRDENSPEEKPESVKEGDRPSRDLRRRQQKEADEDGERRGISEADDFTALSSARSHDDEVEEDDRDEDWKPDEEPRGSGAEKTRRKRRGGRRSGVQTKRRKRTQPSENSVAPLSCKVCRALRGSTSMLIKHCWSHLDDPERLCGVCGEHSESAEELRSHLHSHQKTHSCDVCGKLFLTVVTLNRHAALHTGDRPYKCDICHKAFSSKASLNSHRWQHVEEKPHKCDVCNQSFPFKQQLRVHKITHTGEKPYCCDVCGKTVNHLRSLSRHKLVHTGEKRFGCPVCGKRFASSANLKVHKKIHTQRNKPHLCHVCPKAFHTASVLKAHLDTHSDQKVTCGVCGRILVSPAALKGHMIVHSGERPYKCPKCRQAFRYRANLNMHLRIHSGVKLFACRVCGKECGRRDHLTVHMRTHNGERPYKCTLCAKAFTQSHCLKTHMKSHRGEHESAADGLQS